MVRARGLRASQDLDSVFGDYRKLCPDFAETRNRHGTLQDTGAKPTIERHGLASGKQSTGLFSNPPHLRQSLQARLVPVNPTPDAQT